MPIPLEKKHWLKHPFFANGWRLLFFDHNETLKSSDVVVYGGAHPLDIEAHSPSNPKGFIIKGMAGISHQTLFNALVVNGYVKDSMAIWRKEAHAADQNMALPRAKREYVPSIWATPVPLP